MVDQQNQSAKHGDAPGLKSLPQIEPIVKERRFDDLRLANYLP
jgi:hypothetical protein